MLVLTLALLLPQVGTSTDVIGSLPSPVLSLEIAQPQQLFGTILESRFEQQLLESSIWVALEDLPQYPMVEVAWQTFLAPAQGDPKALLGALAGDGALFFMTSASTPGAFEFSLLTNGHDGELAQDCLAPLLGFAGISRSKMKGETWSINLDGLALLRAGDRFAFGTNAALLQQYLATPFAQLQKSALPSACRAVADNRGAQAVMWMQADLLRVNGYPELPDDAGASYLFGGAHEVLRIAPWIGAALHFSTAEIEVEIFAPAADNLPKTHAPFFPPPAQTPMPKIDNMVMQGVFARDLGAWWTARHLYMQERAVVDSVETDGTLALLFGREPGPEVFAWLESDIRLLAAVLPENERTGLPIEYPSGAMGLRLKKGAPEDLDDAFISGFLAAVTFANLDNGTMGRQPLLMKVEEVAQGSLYSASYRTPPQGQPLAARHNLSPAILVGSDGMIWISSSLSLLRAIAVAPSELVDTQGMWLDFEVSPILGILARDRDILVANRLLEEGGDIQAATNFVDMMMSGLAIFETASIRSRLNNGMMSLQVEIQAAP